MHNKGEYTFEKFIVYEGNRLAYGAAYEVSVHPDRPLSPLYIYSSTGLGKTHLVNAVAVKMREVDEDLNIVITTGEKFTNDFIYALRKQKLQELYEEYECLDVLIIDNVQQFASSRNLQTEFHEIFDMLLAKNKQIILTGNEPPTNLNGFDKSLLSKVRAGFVVEIEEPYVEDRITILRTEAERALARKDIQVKKSELERILSFIVNAENSDIRKLKGMLHSVIAFAEILDEKMDLTFTEKILRS